MQRDLFQRALQAAFTISLATQVFGGLTACKSSSSNSHGGTTTCNPGYVAVDDSCAKLCEADSECPSGNICGSGTLTEICVVGQRTDAPVIESIDGDGTPNGAAGEFAHHLKHAIIVTGQHFEGVDVTLAAPGGAHADVTVTARSPQQLTVALPVSVVDEGTYHLVVHGGAGDSTQSFQIMRGEVGETGFPGATYITRGVLYGTTNLTDATTVAIMVDNPNNQISDSHHFPTGGAAGVMLTAINRINHTLVTSLPAGSWFADPNGSAALVAALNDLTEDTFVLLASRGNVSAWLRDGNGAETALATLLKQFGAAPGVHLLASTEAFVFAGRKGLSAGNGVFIAGTASASTSVSMVDNDIIGASSVNYGVCVRDNANCTIPVDRIVGSGTLPTNFLPNGLAGLSVTSSGDAVTIANTGGVTTTGPLTTQGTITATAGAISGAISAASATVSGAFAAASAVFTENVTINGNIVVKGDPATPVTTCTMEGAASTYLWPTSASPAGNNHCYGLYTTPRTWYAAQLECNKLGAHLATLVDITGGSTGANETSMLNDMLTLSGTTEFWVGLSNYEDLGSPNYFFRWVGSEGTNYAQANPTPENGFISASPFLSSPSSSIANRCATAKHGNSTATGSDHDCTDTYGYICERRLVPVTQPCASSAWWPINGGRLCMEAEAHHGSLKSYPDASEVCAKQLNVAAHLCTLNEILQACSAGMNPFSYANNNVLAPIAPSTGMWYGDIISSAGPFGTMMRTNTGYLSFCQVGNVTSSTADTMYYRCCY